MEIMIVDDEREECGYLADFISGLGHNVTQCYNGDDALKKIDSEAFDLLICDVGLPGRNGIDIVEYLKKESIDLKAILVSGRDEVIRSINAMELGIMDFLIKPIDIKKLANLVELAGESSNETKEPAGLIFNDGEYMEIDDYKFPKDYSIQNDFLGNIGIFSEKIFSIYRKLEKLSEYPHIPVLIEGETGTGKEIIARYIHHKNTGSRGEFVALNCSNLKNELFDAELFGYDRGAFTGADMKGKTGKIKLAENGTLFLDEITELTPGEQAKLLRVIQEREFFKLGGNTRENVTARIITASNRDVRKLVAENRFREDLYYRLDICKVTMPPLRERKDEIVPLAIFFIKSAGRELGRKIRRIETSALKLLMENDWNGNVRELKNIIMKIILFNETDHLSKKMFETLLNAEPEEHFVQKTGITDFEIPDRPFDLDEFTLDIVRKTLQKFNGNKSKTAKFLGLSRTQLYGRYKI